MHFASSLPDISPPSLPIHLYLPPTHFLPSLPTFHHPPSQYNFTSLPHTFHCPSQHFTTLPPNTSLPPSHTLYSYSFLCGLQVPFELFHFLLVRLINPLNYVRTIQSNVFTQMSNFSTQSHDLCILKFDQ